MPNYRRAFLPGGTFFFTVASAARRPILCTPMARGILHGVLDECRERWPFTIDAIVLLPDHLHTLWVLPARDSNFSTRWARAKKTFTQRWLEQGGEQAPISVSKELRHRRGVWQPRFWEHVIRDEEDWSRHMDYIHYNPVHHGLTACPHQWEYSTIGKWIGRKVYEANWCCVCGGGVVKPPEFGQIPVSSME